MKTTMNPTEIILHKLYYDNCHPNKENMKPGGKLDQLLQTAEALEHKLSDCLNEKELRYFELYVDAKGEADSIFATQSLISGFRQGKMMATKESGM